jgi:hypothetical protein
MTARDDVTSRHDARRLIHTHPHRPPRLCEPLPSPMNRPCRFEGSGRSRLYAAPDDCAFASRSAAASTSVESGGASLRWASASCRSAGENIRMCGLNPLTATPIAPGSPGTASPQRSARACPWFAPRGLGEAAPEITLDALRRLVPFVGRLGDQLHDDGRELMRDPPGYSPPAGCC